MQEVRTLEQGRRKLEPGLVERKLALALGHKRGLVQEERTLEPVQVGRKLEPVLALEHKPELGQEGHTPEPVRVVRTLGPGLEGHILEQVLHKLGLALEEHTLELEQHIEVELHMLVLEGYRRSLLVLSEPLVL